MTEQDLQPLRSFFERKMTEVPTLFRRSLYDVINWNEKIIGIKGPRGAGKSTILMQRIMFEHIGDLSKVFYVSLDHFWFDSHQFMDLVEYLYVHGVTHLFVDEVHRYKGWSKAFKNIYDGYPDLSIVYTGSSALKIDNAVADLSRRQTVYDLNVMSFREFLCLELGEEFETHTLEDILQNHTSIARVISSKVKIIPLFDRYLKEGEYPFYRIEEMSYHNRLLASYLTVLESDMPDVEKWEWVTIQKAKKLLSVISPNIPFIPNIVKLAEQLECTRETCLKMLYALERAKLLMLLHSPENTYKQLSRPEKIYLGDTNMVYAYNSNADTGNVRETFFLNQLSSVHSVKMPKKGDFTVDEKSVFEVGGADKNFSQIKDLPNSYLAVDDTEIGYGNRIPLWVFGMMY